MELETRYNLNIMKKQLTQDEKELLRFRNNVHHLLAKYPRIRLVGDLNGDVVACMHSDPNQPWKAVHKTYVPKSGSQEVIAQ